MRKRLPDDITKCCALCEHAKKVPATGEILCGRTKHLKKVSEDYRCRKFSFDILAYRPNPTKLPKFTVDSVEDIL
ncbi:MAG: hypothetical protein J6E38_05895 [Clostridia bacterium]|nr:hypothetical protein [Clostridia bacterium]